jgi:hypothetical protein
LSWTILALTVLAEPVAIVLAIKALVRSDDRWYLSVIAIVFEFVVGRQDGTASVLVIAADSHRTGAG